jgi:arsenate reductase
MAEGYLRHFDPNLEVYSAGVETHGVNPRAESIMKEDGIDISNHTSNHIDEYLHIDFDHIITVCDHAKERCPVIPGKANRVHQNFPDPAKTNGSKQKIKDSFEYTRDLIKAFCKQFVAGLNNSKRQS